MRFFNSFFITTSLEGWGFEKRGPQTGEARRDLIKSAIPATACSYAIAPWVAQGAKCQLDWRALRALPWGVGPVLALDVTGPTDTSQSVNPLNSNVTTFKKSINFGTSENKMPKRKKLSKQKSKRLFSKTAGKTHGKNISPAPMRGGIRL